MKSALAAFLLIVPAIAGSATIRWPSMYPEYASENCIDGDVTLRYEVGLDGKATNIEVVHAEPEGIFEEVAIEAFSRWHLKDPPGTRSETVFEFRVSESNHCNS